MIIMVITIKLNKQHGNNDNKNMWWLMYVQWLHHYEKTPATQEMLSSKIVNLTRLENTWCMYQPKIYWFCLRVAMIWDQNMSKSCHPFATIPPPRASWKPEIQLLDPMLVRLHPNHAEHHPIQGWRCAACICPSGKGYISHLWKGTSPICFILCWLEAVCSFLQVSNWTTSSCMSSNDA